MNDSRYTRDSSWYWAQIINTNLKAATNVPDFEHLHALVAPQHAISQLAEVSRTSGVRSKRNGGTSTFLEGARTELVILSRCAFPYRKVVRLLIGFYSLATDNLQKVHSRFLWGLNLLTFPISNAIAERAFSMFRVIDRKECDPLTGSNIAKYTCMYRNKLSVWPALNFPTNVTISKYWLWNGNINMNSFF